MVGPSVVGASAPLLQRSSLVLKQVDIERKPNGLPVSVPAVLSDATLDQHVKRFIEVADGDPGDRHGLIALFRKYHGGA